MNSTSPSASSARAAVVGAGVAGRVLALRLLDDGWSVTVFDRGEPDGRHSCSWAAAGMIAPNCEREAAEPEIERMGLVALDRWPAILAALDAPVRFRQDGSLVVAHPRDRQELLRLRGRLRDGALADGTARDVDAAAIAELEPELERRFAHGLYMTREAYLDNRQALPALASALTSRGADVRFRTPVQAVRPHEVDGERFDLVFDCRGLEAQPELPRLRGVRGELLVVMAPDVHLRRSVRMMHPRYPIYIVPRDDQGYIIGATAIESEDAGPVSVRGAMELLSAAYALHPGFAEARILHLVTHCRPAFPDNRPRILTRPGLMRINGLYRHGWLLAPVFAETAAALAQDRTPPGPVGPLVEEDAA